MKRLRTTMITLALLVAVAVGSTFLFMQQSVFGSNPATDRLERILHSKNYQNGSFQNLEVTPVMPEDASYWGMMKDFINKDPNNIPAYPLPSVKTDLKALADDKPSIVWFGHSSYLIKSKGITVLVDPVFSGNASPVSFFGKSFPGSDVYRVDDMPDIDLLILSHDHYDHLDYKTITQLIPKVKKFYTALGVGAHLQRWGVPTDRIVEFDWWDKQQVSDSIALTAVPARHFSGRSFTRGKPFGLPSYSTSTEITCFLVAIRVMASTLKKLAINMAHSIWLYWNVVNMAKTGRTFTCFPRKWQQPPRIYALKPFYRYTGLNFRWHFMPGMSR
jgi:hypothetical protein